MGNIYLIRKMYKPNRAETNRFMGFVKRFDERGIATTVVFFCPDDNKSKVSDVFKNVRFEYWWGPFLLRRKFHDKFVSPFSILRFAHSLRDGDIVYLSGMNAYLKRFVKLKGVRVYHEATEYPELPPVRFPRLVMRERNLYKQSLPFVDGMFVISTFLRDYYIKNGVPGNRVTIINMTVDLGRFENVTKEKGERYIAYCGDVCRYKDGVDNLVRAYGLIAKHIPEVKLYIIGNFSVKEDGPYILNMVDDLQIRDKVVFTGLVSAERMPALLKNAEVLALARPDNIQARYGFATKLGEYLSTGNPVVVTDVGDFSKFLVDGESALLAPPDDVNAFAERLLWVFNHTEEAKNIGRKGREVAMASFDSRVEADKMIDAMSVCKK